MLNWLEVPLISIATFCFISMFVIIADTLFRVGDVIRLKQRRHKSKQKRNAQPMTPVADLFEDDKLTEAQWYPSTSTRAPMFSDYTYDLWYNPPDK